MEGADFLLLKEPPLVDRYVELVEQLQPRHIFELGIFEGGSTAFLFELARPDVLVAIDQNPPRMPALREFVGERDPGDALRIYDDVDQGDRSRLARILEEAFGDHPLDLVIDDCSHLYDPTRASFNELFPRLRPGGVYVIEDWRWAHSEMGSKNPGGIWPDEMPLTKLVFELVLAIPAVPGLIADVRVDTRSVEVTRGDATVDPRDFEISSYSDARGRALLAD
jgi:SAM-dependent methyltransferase